MTTETGKQDYNKQIAGTEEQPVCWVMYKTQRELTPRTLAPLPYLAGGLPSLPIPQPLEMFQELATTTCWLTWPL